MNRLAAVLLVLVLALAIGPGQGSQAFAAGEPCEEK